MKEKLFNCVLGNDYHIINNNVDNMTYFLQDGNDVVLVINLLNKLYEENEQLRRDKNFLQNERRLQEKGIFTLFDEVNKLNKENENLKIDHRIMGEKLYIMSKDYIKDVGDDDEC